MFRFARVGRHGLSAGRAFGRAFRGGAQLDGRFRLTEERRLDAFKVRLPSFVFSGRVVRWRAAAISGRVASANKSKLSLNRSISKNNLPANRSPASFITWLHRVLISGGAGRGSGGPGNGGQQGCPLNVFADRIKRLYSASTVSSERVPGWCGRTEPGRGEGVVGLGEWSCRPLASRWWVPLARKGEERV